MFGLFRNPAVVTVDHEGRLVSYERGVEVIRLSEPEAPEAPKDPEVGPEIVKIVRLLNDDAEVWTKRARSTSFDVMTHRRSGVEVVSPFGSGVEVVSPLSFYVSHASVPGIVLTTDEKVALTRAYEGRAQRESEAEAARKRRQLAAQLDIA